MANEQPKSLGPLSGVAQLSAEYVDQMYEQWQRTPDALPDSWQLFFQGFELASCPRDCIATERARSQSDVDALIAAYRTGGHLLARTDPLGRGLDSHPSLELSVFGLSRKDFDQVYDTSAVRGPERATLEDLLTLLTDTYCRSVGVEYMHIQNLEIRRWLEERMERVRNRPTFDKAKKLAILGHLVDAELFERFLQTHYPGQKRFSLEGGETLIPAVHALVIRATEHGVREVMIGMPHRGRLNVLANILDKSYACIFAEFQDVLHIDRPGGDGDVKYHKGFQSDHDDQIRVTLTANPSHLEAVDPVVEGRARAMQRIYGDTDERKLVVPVLIHGDAAFAGQGLVAETLNLSQLEGYRTGGTVHIVVNNQIGFTASPDEVRSSRYATDVLKMIEAPIFHVNGDDPEAVVHVVELALDYRQAFGGDVGIDMVCYRRHGHSEIDDPGFTHPVLYKIIKEHPSPRAVYATELLASGHLSQEEVTELEESFGAGLAAAFERVEAEAPTCEMDPDDERWDSYTPDWSDEAVETGVTHERLVEVARALTTVPEGFEINSKLGRQLPKRFESVAENQVVDWAMAESLAFGTLLRDGSPVRLSGQDSSRGTFSHRHAAWRDVESGERYVPAKNLHPDQASFCVYNSSLSEASVLGFDYGYSMLSPEMLILWEAQFGDFANGAQVIIDQFVVCSQAKWGQTSGLVMLLPHGYEGQGPEHSNAYLERYLSACADKNIQVCNLTTPAQYFHVLRRQMKRSFRRPLILMAPKSLLRHPKCVSPVTELTEGSFVEIIDDPSPPEKPSRVVLCSGKVYYDLLAARDESQADAALVRVEQLYPLSKEKLLTLASKYSSAEVVVWAQEEPENRGAYRYIRPTLDEVFKGAEIRYAGRMASPSPATGSLKVHRKEQAQLVQAALAD